MQPIDRPFRLTWDFCVAWGLLALAFRLPTAHQHFAGPWYSYVALLILASLFGTFVLYGPVLLVRQVMHSGPRGWFVLQVFLSIVLTCLLLLVGLSVTRGYTENQSHLFAFVVTILATAFLSWRLGR